MYPSGVGTSYVDPRKSNFSKSQSIQYQRGIGLLKDFGESTANSNPHPTDALGTNLRKGKGLSFHKGIAHFDGFSNSNNIAPPLSRQAEAAENKAPNYDAYVNHQRSSPHYSNSTGQYLVSNGIENYFPDSARGNNNDVLRADDDRSQPQSARSYGSRPSSSHYSQSPKFRPQTAPMQRAVTDRGELPAWAKDNVFTPTFDKTVENAKARPSSARIRPQSGLPLSHVPKWISQDKKVLSFEAYFKEGVQESRIEHYRVRRCVMQYFLEDDTIKISEPREENSGIPQGSFLKRHKVMKEGGQGFVSWRDLRVPGDVTLYGRTFRITKCDQFTATFFRERGIMISSEEHVPMDPVHLARSRPSSAVSSVSVGRDGEPSSFHGRLKNDMSEYIEARLGRCQDKKAMITKYLANDRKVLRFYCTWNDKNPDGVVQKRPFILHFFLADDTVEILEVKEVNSGRDPFPALLKRMKLPKGFTGMSPVGSGGVREYYVASDFKVGGVVSVFGRHLVINDCDEATRQYYDENYGMQFSTHVAPAEATNKRPRSAVIVPPHNGFGKEEDSRQNCLSLHPKPPKVDVIRLLENKGKVLRYVGKLENAVGFDIERVFIITYYLDTDELLIFEPAVKNSGRTGGKFMEKCKVHKPNSSEYYSEADLFLGARVVAFSRRFVLVDADEFTIKYMESNPQIFPYSSVDDIMHKLEAAGVDAVTRAVREKDKLGTGKVSADAFKEALVRNDLGLNDQMAHTLSRHLAVNGSVDYNSLLTTLKNGKKPAPSQNQKQNEGAASFEDANARLRSQLYKRGPTGLRGLQRAMMHISRGSGSIDRTDFDTVLGFCGVSLSEAQASAVFARYDRGEGVIESSELIEGLRPPLSKAQERAVLAVFDSLEDPTFKTGAVEVDEVCKRYKPVRHIKVAHGEMTEAEALRELEDGLEGHNGTVMAKDLLNFYADVVAGYKLTDDQLIELLRATWGLSGRR